LWEALLPVGALLVLLHQLVGRHDATAHIPLLLATAVAAALARRRGLLWAEIQRGMVEAIAVSLPAVLILLVVGMLIGTWIAGGIVPVLIYHGLNLLSPSVFLVATCLICCLVSLATGSSWTTAGTVGVALIGVGQGLGVPLPMVAGAIISGAYFGDKISPLSDTTNLAPAVAGAELFEHVRYMMYTTLPSLAAALVIFAALGWSHDGGGASFESVTRLREALAAKFTLHPVLLLPPLLVIVMVVLRLPALPALLAGVLAGGVLAGTVQGAALKDILAAAHKGYVSQTGDKALDELLTRGGMESMLSTVALILCALSFGGVMERAGFLEAIARHILRLARGTGQLVAATIATCVGMNIVAADQYLTIIVSGRMFRGAYAGRGLQPKLLSRSLEDAGTLTSPLVPWNSCGAFMATTLGVGTLAYLPYAFLNLLSPLVAVGIAAAGWRIARSQSSPANQGTEAQL
jgi:NhaC family Na+:H+ antiporter